MDLFYLVYSTAQKYWALSDDRARKFGQCYKKGLYFENYIFIVTTLDDIWCPGRVHKIRVHIIYIHIHIIYIDRVLLTGFPCY